MTTDRRPHSHDALRRAFCPNRNRIAAMRGFTLLEVIVAFALLALGLTLLLGALTRATGQVGWAAESGRASLHAQSLLDQIEIEQPLAPGRRQGDFEDGRYHWTLQIAPWRDPLLSSVTRSQAPDQPRLLELQLTVSWGDAGPREKLQVHSLRLVPPPSYGIGP